jgi:ATP-dependent HslUV protease ATP-binding subunit HslU
MQHWTLMEVELTINTYFEMLKKELAEIAFQVNSEVENIGARRLQTVMSRLLNELLFDIPDKIGANAKVVITKQMVGEKLDGLVKDKDLSQYIL